MSIITLLTDFGMRDGYPGVMKGVILKIAPNVQIVDLSHEIPPQDVIEAALTLWRSTNYFPDGTIHVAVVDPGVGTNRRAIAANIGTQYFVGPDNGIFSSVLSQAEEYHQPIWIGELNQPNYWLPNVSHTFHGRDIFAPVAGYIAAGVPIEQLSARILDPIRLVFPNPLKIINGLSGQVIHVDHFGNLSTNIKAKETENNSNVTIVIKGMVIDELITSFAEKLSGSIVALIDSSGYLAISVVNGSAAEQLHASVGDPVELHFSERNVSSMI